MKIFLHGLNLVQILRSNLITLEVEYETFKLKEPSEMTLFSSHALEMKKMIQVYPVT